MEQKNSGKWDKNFLLALLGIIVSFILGGLALLFTVATPELRDFFGLKDHNPPALLSTPTASAPSVPAPQQTPEQAQPRSVIPPSKAVPTIEQQHIEKPKPPSGPFAATLHENQPQFIEAAKTGLSIIFNEEYNIVTLTIAPDGRQSSNHAVLNGYSEEFTSSAGVFLVHVLNADWNSRTVTVQVSRKSHQVTASKDKD